MLASCAPPSSVRRQAAAAWPIGLASAAGGVALVTRHRSASRPSGGGLTHVRGWRVES